MKILELGKRHFFPVPPFPLWMDHQKANKITAVAKNQANERGKQRKQSTGAEGRAVMLEGKVREIAAGRETRIVHWHILWGCIDCWDKFNLQLPKLLTGSNRVNTLLAYSNGSSTGPYANKSLLQTVFARNRGARDAETIDLLTEMTGNSSSHPLAGQNQLQRHGITG